MVAAVQLPLAPSPTTAPPLDPRLFRPGTLLEALVVGKTANGLVQLQIADLLVTAKLPQMPAAGTLLQLAVKAGGAVPELVVVAQQPPVQPTAPIPIPAVTGAMPLPAVEEGAPPALFSFEQNMVSQSSPPVVMASRVVSSLSATPALPSAATAAPLPVVAIALAAEGAPAATSTPNASPAVPAAATNPDSPAQIPAASLAPPSATTSPAPATAPGASQRATVQVPLGEASESQLRAATTMPAAAPEAQARANLPSPPPQPVLVARAVVAPPAIAIPQGQPPLAVLPQSPQAAVIQMAPAALAQQGSPAPLFQALAAAVATAVPLPAPVLRAAQQLLANRVPVATLSGEVLKTAVERAGVSLEAVLATGSPPPANDAKAGLLALRSALVSWLGEQAPVDPVRRVPPPIKGETLRAQSSDALPELPSAARDIGRVLHGHTEAALSRLKLMQVASLPDADGSRQGGPEMRLELPLLVGNELAMAQLQIFRDGSRRRDAAKRGWAMRFAVATRATGEVGAEVGLIGKSVNVALWAAEEATANALAESLPELNQGLGALGLVPSIRLRAGPPRGVASAPGQFVDHGS